MPKFLLYPKNVNPENIKISESEIQQYYNATRVSINKKPKFN
jgi:hypothetical protein